MDRIPSFSKNHDTLETGLHVSMKMHGVTTWDLRFKKPNAGDYISPKALHTVEHLLATTLRNSEHKNDIIYPFLRSVYSPPSPSAKCRETGARSAETTLNTTSAAQRKSLPTTLKYLKTQTEGKIYI